MPEEKSNDSVSHVHPNMPKEHNGKFGGDHAEGSKDHTSKGYSVSRDTAGHIERTEIVKKA